MPAIDGIGRGRRALSRVDKQRASTAVAGCAIAYPAYAALLAKELTRFRDCRKA